MISKQNLKQKLDILSRGQADLPAKLLAANAIDFAHCALTVNDYLSYRAGIAEEEYSLLPGHFMAWLLMGERCFFGVHVCSSHLRPSRDDNEPYPGCLEEWAEFTEGSMAHEEITMLREMLGEAGVVCPPIEPMPVHRLEWEPADGWN